MSGAADMSGNWIGFYSFPIDLPPVRFDAVLLERAGRITGSIEEIDEAWGNGHLVSTVDGTRSGLDVRFTKFYDSGDENFDTVQYEGTLDADSAEISGEWHIPGEWSGSFIMTRERAAEVEIAVHRSASVD
ncbi:MAG: hypothetical protein ACAH11_01750 [Sphingomonas sp.]